MGADFGGCLPKWCTMWALSRADDTLARLQECVAAEAEKVRARDSQASPHPRGSSHRTVHTRFPHASFRAVA